MTLLQAIQRHSGMTTQQIWSACLAPEQATGFSSPGSCESFVIRNRQLVFSTIYNQALERYYQALRLDPPHTDGDYYCLVARFILQILPTL